MKQDPAMQPRTTRMASGRTGAVANIDPSRIYRRFLPYQEPTSKQYVLFTRHGINIKKFPAVEHYLLAFKDRLASKLLV